MSAATPSARRRAFAPSLPPVIARRVWVLLLVPIAIVVVATLLDNAVSVWHTTDSRLRNAVRFYADYCTGKVDAADMDITRITMCNERQHVIDTSGVLFRLAETLKLSVMDFMHLTFIQSPRAVFVVGLLLLLVVLVFRMLAMFMHSVTPPYSVGDPRKYA